MYNKLKKVISNYPINTKFKITFQQFRTYFFPYGSCDMHNIVYFIANKFTI